MKQFSSQVKMAIALVDSREMKKNMEDTVKRIVPLMTKHYLEAEKLKKSDDKTKFMTLITSGVVPTMKELFSLKQAAEHCLDLTLRPFSSLSAPVLDSIILQEISQQDDSHLSEVALTWGRRVYSTMIMRKEVPTDI